jgi:hypothetical protein
MNTTEEIVETVRNLPPENQRELFEALQDLEAILLANGEPRTEEQVQQILFARGVISTVPRPCDYPDAEDDFKPLEIKGKPLSETVIEERR